MAKNNNNFKFNIPVPLIILAYIVYWPVGIVLTVLRSISVPSEKKTDSENSSPYQRSGGEKVHEKKRKKNRIPQLLTLCGMISAGLSALFAVDGIFWRNSMIYFVEMGIPLLAAAVVCFIGAKVLKNRDEQRNRIRTIIGNRSSLNLSKLAQACDMSLKKIRREVQKLIDKGEFGESAYIDLGANNFMRNPYAEPDDPEAFDYKTVYGNLFKEEKKNDRKAEQKTEPTQNTSAEVPDEKDDFGKIIREIRRLNDDIKDVAVSYRIEQIEEHTKNIFEYVTDHPEAMPQIRTFMNYYLPTTLKLLESYSRIERVGVAGENMKKAKNNIENTLDLLVVGFEQQVDQLFRNESIDISSDISVLEAMMQKDGLSGKTDFDLQALAKQYSDEISDDLSSGGAAAQKMPE